MNKHVLLGIFFLIALSIPDIAFSQQTTTAPPNDRDFELQTFRVSPGRGGFLTVEGARVDDHLGWSLGLMTNYAYQPLAFKLPDSTVGLVKHRLQLDVLASFSIYEVIEFGFVLPITAYQGGNDAVYKSTSYEDAPKTVGGLNDPRLHLKWDLLNGTFGADSDTFGLAIIGVLGFPVGNSINPDDFMGDSNFTGEPKLAFQVNVWRFRIGLNMGYLIREEKKFYQSKVDDAITFGGAADFLVTNGFKLMMEIYGQNGLEAEPSSSPLEMYGALGWKLVDDLWMQMGLGGGYSIGDSFVNRGMGAPVVRTFLAFKYEKEEEKLPPRVDTDKDGLFDDEDRCPNDPEDFDKFKDTDGCPDEDNDKDGIKDKLDTCPNRAEDIDGFRDEDGCPDPDNDRDDIKDDQDKCPMEREDIDGFEDEDGCPELDNDQDGFVDLNDQCPNEKEVFNGVDDEDGCPDEGEQLLVMEKDEIKILDQIRFKSGSATIIGKKSFKVLDSIAGVLKANPNIKLRIEGHTDNKGRHDFNVKLSQKRAESVMNYLIEKDINTLRLKAVGFGPDKPIQTNRTQDGRAANRRVEFHITEQ